jgi:hypothetical protein
MILHHYSPRKYLASIFKSGLDTGRMPVTSDTFKSGVVWFTTADWRERPGVPRDDGMVCIRVDFEDDCPELELWSHANHKHLPAKFFQFPRGDRIYVYHGVLSPDRFLDVHNLLGKQITANDTALEYIVRNDVVIG